MKTLENVTVYQCEFCDKRFLTKNGAKKHEERYCYLSPIKAKREADLMNNCNHEWAVAYETMVGETYAQEPSHEYCIECGMIK